MAVYEKRGYIKEYDENGKLVKKTLKDSEPAPVQEEEPEQDLFEAE